MVGVASGARLALGLGALAAAMAPPAMQALQQSRPLRQSQLVWLDRAGKRLSVLGSAADYGDLELSPDGTHVSVAIFDVAHGARDLWIYDVSSRRRTAFAADSADENWSAWAPDGQRLAFNSERAGHLDLFVAPLSGAAMPETLLTDTDPKWPVSWSPDGRYLLYVTDRPGTGNDIRVLPLFGDRRPFPYLAGPSAENWAAFSPDGQWVAFSSAESGQPEVYVAAFPTPNRKWRVSADGGTQARWERDGKALFYLALDGRLMTVALRGKAPDFDAGGAEPLFELKAPYAQYRAYDVAPDGRILANVLIPAVGAPVVAH